jgi:hypothetical protein
MDITDIPKAMPGIPSAVADSPREVQGLRGTGRAWPRQTCGVNYRDEQR